MRLADPWWLLILPWVFLLIPWRRKRASSVTYSAVGSFGASGKQISPRWILNALRFLSVVMLVLAICRPQSGKSFSELTSEGIDIILALDTSGSMRALDFEWKGERENRLSVVKRVVREFVEKRPGDRIGLVVFGEDAYTQCPLTLDHPILDAFIDNMEIGMAGDSTAIGSAIGVSVKHMKELKAKSKVMILLTDGASNAGSLTPVKAAEVAATFGIKIYTIGVGRNERAPFPMNTPLGTRIVYQHVPLDEDTLRKVADITQGKYFRASDSQSLSKVYESIDTLEKRELKTKAYTEYEERFFVFALIALILMLVEWVGAHTFLRTIP